jgi:hypothetical protein
MFGVYHTGCKIASANPDMGDVGVPAPDPRSYNISLPIKSLTQ